MKNGILVVHKPEGLSSARVVAQVKKILGAKKLGHTGTLDPFATGVLLCAVNKGTRISRFFLGGDKQYKAQIRLGAKTDTYDRTGRIVETVSNAVMGRLHPDTVSSVVASFRGVQKQIPPVYSALKHEGQPLYKLARNGIKVEKPARKIEIHEISITKIDLPVIDVTVDCSSGTYIRSIAHDIGEKLGCGAHLAELCRTRSGSFALDDAVGLDMLEAMGRTRAEQEIVPLSDCLSFLPKKVMSPDLVAKIRHGQPLTVDDIGETAVRCTSDADPSVRLVDDNNTLLAVVHLPEKSRTYNYSCVFAS